MIEPVKIKFSLILIAAIILYFVYTESNSVDDEVIISNPINVSTESKIESVPLIIIEKNSISLSSKRLNQLENSNATEKQISFIKKHKKIEHEDDIFYVAEAALLNFDTNNNGLVSEEEAPFLLYLANRFIPVEKESITLESHEYQELTDLLRGKTDSEISNSDQLQLAKERLSVLTETINKEISSHKYRELNLSEIENTFFIIFHWSDLNFDGELNEEFDMHFFSAADHFFQTLDNN